MNEELLTQGFKKDAEQTAREREWEEVRRRQRLNQVYRPESDCE